MNISNAAKVSGLSIKTIRYYSEIKLVNSNKRSDSGYRIYNDKDVKKLIFVRRAREFGFSIRDCKELLNLYEDKMRSSREVKKIASKRLKEIIKKQQELQFLNDELSILIKKCRGDKKPDCPIIEELANL